MGANGKGESNESKRGLIMASELAHLLLCINTYGSHTIAFLLNALPKHEILQILDGK